MEDLNEMALLCPPLSRHVVTGLISVKVVIVNLSHDLYYVHLMDHAQKVSLPLSKTEILATAN